MCGIRVHCGIPVNANEDVEAAAKRVDAIGWRCMEITCNRCHQTVQAENCYCPKCGMPQLQYTAAESTAGQPEAGIQPTLDAGAVVWKPALRAALLFALPAGVLASGLSPSGIFGLLWMAAAASWAVAMYVRSQKPAWITLGAGARIGLVTGLIAGWMAFAVSGGTLFVERFVLHQSGQMDASWKNFENLNKQAIQQVLSSRTAEEAAQMQAMYAPYLAMLDKPEGRAGVEALSYASNSLLLVFFGMVGGALGARLMARSRRPEI